MSRAPRRSTSLDREVVKIAQRTCERTYVGIDNGVSGSIGVASDSNSQFHLTPIFNCLSYTKKVKNINRVNVEELRAILEPLINPMAVLERPMVNPGRFDATISAIRALEATLIVLESLTIPYRFIDSKEWQSVMLPKGVQGADKLKAASLDIGRRLFPQFVKKFKKDADGMLIAECARRLRW